MDKYQEMRVFKQVIDAGSFIGASDDLNMSKAAVSRYVSDLESRLGVRLLNRTTRRLSLTAEGEVFYHRCKELLGGIAFAEEEVSTQTGEAAGTLKINVPVSFGILHLAPVWAAFHAKHPKVNLEIILSDHIADIIEEGYDLAIRITQLQNSSLIFRKLSLTRSVMCASPEYLRQAGTPQHPREVAHHAVIAYTYASVRDDWQFTGPQGEAVVVKTKPVIRTNNGDTCRICALQHQGIILQPTFMLSDDLASGALVEICPDYRFRDIGIYAVYASRQYQTPKVRLLIDFLVNYFETPRWRA